MQMPTMENRIILKRYQIVEFVYQKELLSLMFQKLLPIQKLLAIAPNGQVQKEIPLNSILGT